MAEVVASQSVAWYRRYGWGIPFGLAILVALFGASVLFLGPDPNDFEASTGTTLDDFIAATPAAALYLDRVERLLAVMAFGFGAWTAFVAFVYLKSSDRRAWYAMWLLPGVMGALGAVFFMREASGLGSFYFGAMIVALVGQLLSYPPK